MEQWKTIVEFENYEVSNLGRVRRSIPDSLGRPCKVLKPNRLKKGYLQVGLYKNGKVHPRLVHILVAKAFIPNPLGLPQVNHLGNNDDCRAVMLEWRTEAGNMQHAVKTGRKSGSGASFNKRDRKWVTSYSPTPNHRVHLGSFATETEALERRNAAIRSMPDRL